MPDDVSQSDIRDVARDAARRLRSVVPHADRDEARRIYSELNGIAAQIRLKHNFVKGGTHVKRVVVRVG